MRARASRGLGLLAGAVLLAVLPAGCAVRTVDCWQLDGAALEEAQAKGWCRDAFAPNVQTIVPIGEAGQPPAQRRRAEPATPGSATPGSEVPVPPPPPRKPPVPG